MDLLILLDPCFKEYTLEAICGWVEEARFGLYDADRLKVMQKDLIFPLERIVDDEYQRIGQKHNSVTQAGMAFIQAADEIVYRFKNKGDVDEWHIETLDNCWRDLQCVIGWGKALDDEKHRQTQSDRAKKPRSIIPSLVSRLIRQHPPETPHKELWSHFFAMLLDQDLSPQKAPDYNQKNTETWEYILTVYDEKKQSWVETPYKFSSFKSLVSNGRKKL